MNYFRKYKLLLVRPEMEQSLNKKITLIRNKIFKEFLPNEGESEHDLSSINQNMSNMFFNMNQDLEMIEEKKLQIPDSAMKMVEIYG